MGVLFTDRFLYTKSCLWQAFSQPCLAITPLSLSQQGPRWEMTEQGALPFSRLTPPHHTHLQRSSAATCQTADTHRLLWIHPKMGSTLESRGRVRAAGKPSDEPLRKGETQSPEVIGWHEFQSAYRPLPVLWFLLRACILDRRRRKGYICPLNKS